MCEVKYLSIVQGLEAEIVELQLLRLLTSKCPPLLINGWEHNTMVLRMQNKAMPVGLAQPSNNPNRPGLVVNIHSQKV